MAVMWGQVFEILHEGAVCSLIGKPNIFSIREINVFLNTPICFERGSWKPLAYHSDCADKDGAAVKMLWEEAGSIGRRAVFSDLRKLLSSIYVFNKPLTLVFLENNETYMKTLPARLSRSL